MLRSFQICKIALVTLCLVGGPVFFTTYFAPTSITFAQLSDPKLLPIQQVKEVEGYKNWAKVNQVPQLMPKRVATDCFLRVVLAE